MVKEIRLEGLDSLSGGWLHEGPLFIYLRSDQALQFLYRYSSLFITVPAVDEVACLFTLNAGSGYCLHTVRGSELR